MLRVSLKLVVINTDLEFCGGVPGMQGTLPVPGIAFHAAIAVGAAPATAPPDSNSPVTSYDGTGLLVAGGVVLEGTGTPSPTSTTYRLQYNRSRKRLEWVKLGDLPQPRFGASAVTDRSGTAWLVGGLSSWPSSVGLEEGAASACAQAAGPSAGAVKLVGQASWVAQGDAPPAGIAAAFGVGWVQGQYIMLYGGFRDTFTTPASAWGPLSVFDTATLRWSLSSGQWSKGGAGPASQASNLATGPTAIPPMLVGAAGGGSINAGSRITWTALLFGGWQLPSVGSGPPRVSAWTTVGDETTWGWAAAADPTPPTMPLEWLSLLPEGGWQVVASGAPTPRLDPSLVPVGIQGEMLYFGGRIHGKAVGSTSALGVVASQSLEDAGGPVGVGLLVCCCRMAAWGCSRVEGAHAAAACILPSRVQRSNHCINVVRAVLCMLLVRCQACLVCCSCVQVGLDVDDWASSVVLSDAWLVGAGSSPQSCIKLRHLNGPFGGAWGECAWGEP